MLQQKEPRRLDNTQQQLLTVMSSLTMTKTIYYRYLHKRPASGRKNKSKYAHLLKYLATTVPVESMHVYLLQKEQINHHPTNKSKQPPLSTLDSDTSPIKEPIQRSHTCTRWKTASSKRRADKAVTNGIDFDRHKLH